MRYNWIPNILSILRIVMAIGFPFAASDLRFIILCLALLSEYFDGWLARKYNWASASGQLLDPIADKLFTLSIGLTFVALNKLSLLELLFISVRDLVAGLGFLVVVLAFKNYKMVPNFKPNLFGKITTAFQYFVFLDVALMETPHYWLILMTGFLSLVAAVIYVFNFYFSFK